MSDRTSAEIFAMIFEHLAEDPDERNQNLAKWLWEHAEDYDFNWYQMDCDDALIDLCLAERLPCECVVYAGEKHDKRDCND